VIEPVSALDVQFTVGELIEALGHFPPERPVIVSVKMHPESFHVEQGKADVVIDDDEYDVVIIGGPHRGYDHIDLGDDDDE
jgi:hypothetical protein